MVIIILVTATSVQFIQPTVFPLVSPGIAARKQEQKPQSRTLFILFMSHGLFVSNRSGSLNRSLFHCYRSQRELDASRSVCTSLSLSFSASRFVDKNPRSTSILHPSVCILAVVHRPAYFSSFSSSPPHPLSHSLLPLPRPLLVGGSGGAHPLCTILRMHACTRARAWLREPYNFYGDII